MCCAAGPHLTDALLEEVLALADRTDSVELTLCLPDPDRHVAVRSLDIDVLDAAIRQVYFFDTPDLQCNGAGVAVRARRLQGRGDDSMIKLRPVVPDDLPPELRRSRDLVVEIDVLPQAFVCSASLQNAQPDGAVREVIHGTGGIRTLFSKDQLAFFREHAPAGITINDLSPLGPITVLEVTYRPDELVRPFVAELWMYPDGTGSLSCPPPVRRLPSARSPRTPGRTWPVAACTSARSSRPGPRQPWSSSPRSWPDRSDHSEPASERVSGAGADEPGGPGRSESACALSPSPRTSPSTA